MCFSAYFPTRVPTRRSTRLSYRDRTKKRKDDEHSGRPRGKDVGVRKTSGGVRVRPEWRCGNVNGKGNVLTTGKTREGTWVRVGTSE